MNVKQIPSSEHVSGFYPTPALFASKILQDITWEKLQYILEPSAGKGDLVKAIRAEIKIELRWRDERVSIDCIEIDPYLRAILQGEGMRVIHDDFLTFHSNAQYDLVVMNPPFDAGAKHLLKALEVIRPGGCVICILNAETTRNPCTNERKRLMQELDRMHTTIEYYEEAFESAERPTLVEVAVIRAISNEQPFDSILLDELRKAKVDPTLDSEIEHNDLMGRDIDAVIDLYNFEAEAGKRFLSEYQGIKGYFLNSTGEYSRPIIEVKIGDRDTWTVNDYLRNLRMKYWHALFSRDDFTANLTSNVSDALYHRIKEFADYEFCHFNIKQLQTQLAQQVVTGIHDTIVKLFDEWTRYAMYDGAKNVHYYNGWKTNEAHKIGEKLIIPYFGSVWRSWNDSFNPTNYEAYKEIRDMEKVFDYLCGNVRGNSMLFYHLQCAEKSGQSRKIELRYFYVSFFKKGTMHLQFKDLDALYRFNLFAARKKNWLPPTYGTKHYNAMTKEEKAVIDGFEGEESYERMMERASEYLHMGRLGIEAPPDKPEETQPDAVIEYAQADDGQLAMFV